MSIRYILGRAGFGKLSKCIEEIFQRETKDKYASSILIVPEQFTLQAESILMKNKQDKILFTTQVLSFKRLAYRVFSEIGLNNKEPLEDIGKIMIFRKIINNLTKQKKLCYFSEKSYSNISILDKINETIQEFLECNIDLNQLDETINNLDIEKNEMTILKLKDLKEIYSEFKKFIEKEYISNEEVLTLLSEKLNKSNLIPSNTVIWIYGFNGFSIQELNVIKTLAKKVEQINICFTYSGKEIHIDKINPFDPFYNIKLTLKKIYENIIFNQNVKLDTPIFLEENFRHKNNIELKHLEKEYFSYKINKFQHKPNNIKVFSAQNKYLEIENIAQEISYLIKYENYRYKDIAVILAEPEYQQAIRLIFNKYNLPYFLDYKKDINQHPLIEFILSALNISIYNWQYQDIFKYLKTGFLDNKLTKDEINILENYVLEYGITGNKWNNKFKYGFYENSVYNEEELNRIRKIVVESLSEFSFNKNKKYNVLDISKKIFNLLVNLQVDLILEQWKEQEKEIFLDEITGNASILDLHTQVWNNMCKVIEKVVQILGEENIYIEEYAKILKSGFEKEKIGILPPTQDQILIGDFERSRFSSLKVLFCLGMNDGIIPKYNDSTNFIDDTEKVILLSKGIELKPVSNIKLVTDNLQIYSIICKPTEKLYFSYSISNLDGKAKRPSSILNKILKIFPELNTIHIDKIKFDSKNIYCDEAMFENLFKFYNEIDEKDDEYLKFKDTFNWFLNNIEYKDKLYNIRYNLNKIKNNTEEFIAQNLIEELYKDKKLIVSISKLEEFKKCPFSYFLKYNINLKEREIQKFDNLKLGNVYHFILEYFSKNILIGSKDLQNLNKADISKVIDNSIEKIYKNDKMESIFNTSKKYNYYLDRIRKIMLMSTYAIFEQMKTSNFKVDGAEIGFGDLQKIENIFDFIEIDLENEFKMFLNGKIDRVDKFKKDDKEYLKVTDYKSSENKITFTELYNGLKLQLLMYLNALIKANEFKNFNKTYYPAGAFYFEIKEEIVDFKNNKKNVYEQYKSNGFLCKDKEVLENFGSMIGVSKLDKEHFDAILKLVNILAKEIGNDITQGNIKIYPYKYGKNSSEKIGCQYCQYKSICKIDTFENNYKYNKLLNLENDDQIWEEISKKIGYNINPPR